MTRWQRVLAGLVVVAVVAVVAFVVDRQRTERFPGPLQAEFDDTDDASADDVGGGTAAPTGRGDVDGVEATVTASTEVTQETLWLCGPGADDDACVGDLDATVVAADGSRTVEPFTPAEDPAVDCFYLYPTVSQASGSNAPLEITAAERDVARAQAARFGEVCRVVAPIYRQVTLEGIFSGAFRDVEARDLAFGDVLSAWNDHVATSGDRPFVLIGHSQGAQDLTRLLATRIEGDPDLRPRLVSALLIGGQVEVPVGADVGGSFRTVPACRAVDQTGCVVAYNSFAETPPGFALFGRGGRRGRGAVRQPGRTRRRRGAAHPLPARGGGRGVRHARSPPRRARRPPSVAARAPPAGSRSTWTRRSRSPRRRAARISGPRGVCTWATSTSRSATSSTSSAPRPPRWPGSGRSRSVRPSRARAGVRRRCRGGGRTRARR